MKTYKKLLFLPILLQVGLIYAQFEPVFHDAGKARVFEVMYQGCGGIDQVNRKTLFAETKNLKNDLNLAEIITRFGCRTMMGQAFIAHTLEKPVSAKDRNSTIQNRQSMIQFMIDHPERRQEFEELIAQAGEYEVVVTKFMQKRFVMNNSQEFMEFFDNFKKRNPVVSSWDQWLHLANFTRSSIQFGTEFLGTFESVPKLWSDLSIFQKAALLVISLFGGTAKDFGRWGGRFPESVCTQNSYDSFMRLPVSAYMLSITAYGMYEHYAQALVIRDSLYALNQLIKIAQKIEYICDQYGVEHQFKVSSIRSQNGIDLLNNLDQERYNDKDTNLVISPVVHAFIYDVYEHDITLAPMYASIAEIDAYLAIAQKMVELQDTDHKFCFVQFLDNEKPTIQATGFWNMLVTKDNVIVNDICEARNIILTGSNEGGKTTAIRAILQNIVLAQSFGIAAASQFNLTQFDVLHSYLNVSDDILHGESRYGSEIKQSQSILARIKALQSNEKFFFAFDELFTGTNGEDGADVSYGFIHNIASFTGIQFIYATHFNKLKTIASANPNCVNYKIEPPLRDVQGKFIRDSKGKLIYPYKLSPGANDVNVAMDRAKDAGIFA